uniref:Uncharacterized protein n=1 Tax=Anguilla anguilla TaxID=7936 RepID=A0A0E9R4H9_ANGAN
MTGLPVTPPYASFVVGCGLKRSTLATPHVSEENHRCLRSLESGMDHA